MSWSDGYNNENDYTLTYCTDISPLRIAYSLLINGSKPPEIAHACELGFGQGLSINFHATDTDVSWTGNDFIPSHVTFASEMKNVAGTEINISDNSFRDMLDCKFDHKFDYICLHGIWSWISDENRSYIKKFIEHNINDNGIVYISYNTKPGWAGMMPVRDLLTNYIRTNLPRGSSVAQKTSQAIKFAEKLKTTKPLYLAVNSSVGKRIEKLSEGDLSYIAHEYFNADWETFYFSEVDAALEGCKLRYAASTDFMCGLDDINITKEQQKLISGLHGMPLRQDLRDICLNQSFRKDVWQKGGRRLSPQERTSEIGKLFVVLRTPIREYDLKINGNLGEGVLQASVYEPILDTLKIAKVDTIGNLIASVSERVEPAQAMEAIHILIAKGDLLLAHDPGKWDELSGYGRKINELIYTKILNGYPCGFLYSAVTGGGLQVNLLQQIFVGTYNLDPAVDSVRLAKQCLEILKKLGKNISDKGVALDSNDAELSTLTTKAEEFLENEVPYFKFLGFVN